MSQWATTPIRREINPVTGLIEGNDKGYRSQRTLFVNPSPLVVPDLTIRAVYDGTDEYGLKKPKTALPGGIRDGQLVLRETAARAVTFMNQLVWEASEGAVELVALDGFRSCYRQEQGFARMLALIMDRQGITPAHHLDKLGEFIVAGETADDTFAFVHLKQDELYRSRIESLREREGQFIAAIEEVARSRSKTFDEVMNTYLTISANAGFGFGTGLNLYFETNSHAGAGACDLMPMRTSDGSLLNIVPFDYPGKEAGADFMEGEGAYEQYITAAKSNLLLSEHLKRLGYATPEEFRLSDWSSFREALRLVYHAAKAIGCTYYSGEVGGENWHIEPGNVVYEPGSGAVVASEWLTAGRYLNSGNTGHTLQKNGKDAIAVWGGNSAHKFAAQHLGLQM